MLLQKTTLSALLMLLFVSIFSGCGSDTASNDAPEDDKYSYTYEGLTLYSPNMAVSEYNLAPINDSSFNGLSADKQLIIADKLLSSFYFGMPEEELQELIDSGSFISTVKAWITQERNDLGAVEERLNDNEGDESEFRFDSYPDGTAQVARILARFYVLEKLDKHFVDYWTAYVLTSTIMFSPAYELASSHSPNIDRVYSNLIRDFRDEATAGYTTFNHMTSDDNWRRFRSPEDNGREMMEIYLLDFNDAHVPIAGKALKNWSLDRDNDTLVVGLDENTEPLSLFDTTIINGFDFYRELVKANTFIPGVTERLVDVYFSTLSPSERSSIVSKIVSSDPQTWQDILLQIVFSKAYLFDSDKPKSAEEFFFSTAKKIHYHHRRGFFSDFSDNLTAMNQASMKYKLGKYTEVPLDTQSFSTYHKFAREYVLMRYTNEWSGGWVVDYLIPDTIFEGISAYEYQEQLEALVNHLFLSTVQRTATAEEQALFANHMLQEDGSYVSPFRLFRDDASLSERRNAALVILDYISRLTETYRFAKVSQ